MYSVLSLASNLNTLTLSKIGVGWYAIMISVAFHLSAVDAQADDVKHAELKSRLKRAWKDREQTYRNARIQWSEEIHLLAKPSYIEGDSPDTSNSKFSPQRLRTSAVLLLSGNRMRYQSRGHAMYDQSNHEYYLRPHIEGFDGKLSMALEQGVQTSRPHSQPIGTIIKRRRSRAASFHTLRSLYWICRGTEANLAGFNISEMPILSRDLKEGELPIIHLSRNGWDIWVDPAAQFGIVNARKTVRNEVVSNVDIRYDKGPSNSTIPKSIIIQRFRSGEMYLEYRMTIQGFKSVSRPSDAEFKIRFPPGTAVTDMSSGKSRNYIVRAEGRVRPILNSELGRRYTYEQLRDSEPGELDSESDGNWWMLMIAAVACAAAIALGVVAIVARRRARSA